MAFLIKALIGVLSTAISACAISYPFAMNSSTSRDGGIVKPQDLNHLSNDKPDELKLADSSTESLEKQREDDNENNHFMTFDELGNTIDNQYTNSQKNEKPQWTASKLPGKEQLKNIIQPSTSTNQKGKISTKEGKSCKAEKINNTELCGALELKNQEDHSYKIGISLSKENQWQVTVVSPLDEGGIETFNQNDQSGKEYSNINYKDLSTSKEKGSDGKNINEISFTLKS